LSMPDQYDDDFEDQEPEAKPAPRKLRDALDRANAEIAELKAQAERAQVLERENALFKANLGSLTEAQQDAVLKTAQEITETGLRSQAELLGFIQPPEPAAPAEDIQAFDRVAQATAGAASPDATNYDAEVAAANSPTELKAVMAKYGRLPEIID
jgi:hypothetical protein